jgi:hypothetical protein
MRIDRFLCVAGAVLGLLFAPAAWGNEEYLWQSEFGSAGFTGEIVLDASASPVAGGGLSDIVSISIAETAGSPVSLTPNSLDGAFTWNSSGITSISLNATDGSSWILDTDSIISLPEQNFDIGSWVAAPAPDSSSTLSLLLATVAARILVKPKLQPALIVRRPVHFRSPGLQPRKI